MFKVWYHKYIFKIEISNLLVKNLLNSRAFLHLKIISILEKSKLDKASAENKIYLVKRKENKE